MPQPFILASSSLQRVALLKNIGIVADQILPSDIDETPKPGELPRQLATRLSLGKLHAAIAKAPNAIILAADTVVACGRRILPKAETLEDVRYCMLLLSGRRHHVYTGVACYGGGKITQRTADSTVIFKQLSLHDIDHYITSREGLGKAGGYAVQGLAASFIRFMSGSHSNIVGLPLYEVSQMLQPHGITGA